MDIQEYKKQQAAMKLLSRLSKAENAIRTGEEWKPLGDLKNSLEIKKGRP